MNRRGFTTIIMVFIVMTIALVGITWFQVRTSSGPSTQEELVEEAGLENLEYSFYNVKRYLRRVVTFSGQRSSQQVSDESGRSDYPYWFCRNTTQVPPKQTVLSELRDSFRKYYEPGASNLRKGVPYEVEGVGGIDSGDVEFKELEKFGSIDPENDRFNISVDIGDVKLNQGNSSRKLEDVEINETVMRNRFWYMYDALNHFVNENNDYMYFKTVNELRKIPDTYEQTDYNEKIYPKLLYYYFFYQCWEDGQKPVPVSKSHPDQIQQAVDRAMGNITRVLEREYFNNQIQCTYQPNSLGTSEQYYPGMVIQGYYGLPFVPETSMTACFDPCDYFGGDCEFCKMECERFPKQLKFDALVDYTITCQDTSYSSVPTGEADVKPLTWSIDISFTAKDYKFDRIKYDPSNPIGEAGQGDYLSFGPSMLNSCAAPGTEITTGGGDDESEEIEWCVQGETESIMEQQEKEFVEMEIVDKFENGQTLCMYRTQKNGNKVLVNKSQTGYYSHQVTKNPSGETVFDYTQEGVSENTERHFEDGQLVKKVESDSTTTTTTTYYDNQQMERKIIIDLDAMKRKVWEYNKEDSEDESSLKPGYPQEESIGGG